MTVDSRDEVWKATWKSYYDSYYQEIFSEKLVLRWQRFDDFSKILIALTASGSAISGWALWNNLQFKYIWLIIAGFGAVLSIIHKSLDIPRRISDWGSSKSIFSSIRMEYEILFDQMKIDPQFSIETITNNMIKLKRQFSEAYKKITVDAFITNRLKTKCQNELNKTINNI